MAGKSTIPSLDAAKMVDLAYSHLRQARSLLVMANCPKSTKAVRLAMSSVAGARRNAINRQYRPQKDR